jgi:hypothetical protein
MLRCLVEHPGQLQTKAALFNAIWPGIVFSDVVLTVCIRSMNPSALASHADPTRSDHDQTSGEFFQAKRTNRRAGSFQRVPAAFLISSQQDDTHIWAWDIRADIAESLVCGDKPSPFNLNPRP